MNRIDTILEVINYLFPLAVIAVVTVSFFSL